MKFVMYVKLYQAMRRVVGLRNRTTKRRGVTSVIGLLPACLVYCVLVFYKKICLKEGEVWHNFSSNIMLLSCLSSSVSHPVAQVQ